MSAFVWSEQYSVNIREIDDQHKKLIGMVGELDDAMAQGKGKQALEKILRELIRYTQTHFATEERIMMAHGYPEHEEHKDKHDKMTQKVLDIQKQYQAGRVTITLDVMQFLQDWLTKHILGTDKKYQPFLNSQGLH